MMNLRLTASVSALQFAHSADAYFALHNSSADAYIPVNEIGRPKRGAWSERRNGPMNVARSFNNWRKYRQTCNELARMSDRELSDIGVNRADIARIARQAI